MPTVGVDPDALSDLVRFLERTAWDLLDRRRAIERLLVSLGMAPAVARRIVEVEDWLADATADLRRRSATVTTTTMAPRPVTAGARLVSTKVGKPHLQKDVLSGKGLSGYCIVGLAYRHVGTQHRTVSRTYEWPDGHRVTVADDQHRGVFTVEPGLGWENVALLRFSPRTWYDHWTS